MIHYSSYILLYWYCVLNFFEGSSFFAAQTLLLLNTQAFMIEFAWGGELYVWLIGLFFLSDFLSWFSKVAEQLLGVMQVVAAVAVWVMHWAWKHPCMAPTLCFLPGHLFHLHLSQHSAHTFQTERPHPCGAVYIQWWAIWVFFSPVYED